LTALCLPLGLALTLALMIGLAGCQAPLTSPQQMNGRSSGVASNEVDMGISSFIQQRVTIKAGQSVLFADPAKTGGIHFICVGTNLKCQPTPGTPTLLAGPNGINFSNGDAPISIPFKTPGAYKVICTIHPGMEVQIFVK
jgi:plastocyanin